MADAKKDPSEVIQRMRALASDEVLSSAAAAEELRSAGVDVGGFTARLQARVKEAQSEVRLSKLRTARAQLNNSHPLRHSPRYEQLDRNALFAQVNSRGLVQSAHFHKLTEDMSDDDLRSLLEDDDRLHEEEP